MMLTRLIKGYIALFNLSGYLPVFFLLAACAPQSQDNAAVNTNKTIVGAGASLPFLVYSGWSVGYHDRTQKKINYQSIGSSAGIKQLNSRTVDFGATDAPLDDITLAQKNYWQFPTVIGGIVLIVNLPGIKTNELILTGTVIADIYQGKIKKWNDPALTALNPALTLPNRDITVVHRSDGSGTTQVFTKYLSQVSADWQHHIGFAATVGWRTGIGGKGNDGVAIAVKTLKNSIGYVEFAYARQNNLIYTKLFNQHGAIITATPASFRAAAAGLNWQQSFTQDLINNPGPGAWPLTTTTYIVLPKNGRKTREILSFLTWGFGPAGAKIVTSLDFVPLPAAVTALIIKKWQTEFKDKSGITLYP